MQHPSAAQTSDSPRDEYQRRRSARQDAHLQLSRRYDAIAHARVAVAVAAAGMAWLVFHSHRLDAAWLVAPVLAFAALVIVHEGIARSRERARRAIAYHEQALARLDHRWMGQGFPGDRYVDPDHLYAAHLDLFGRGSLFELLCTARTRPGQDALAGWLLAPSPPDVVRERQAAVAELRQQLDLRETMALAGQELRLEHDESPLQTWGSRSVLARIGLLQGITLALAVAAVLVGVLWASGRISPLPLGLVVLAEFATVNVLRRRIDAVLLPATGAVDELQVIARLIRCVERIPFSSSLLKSLQHELVGKGDSAARQIALLARRFELLDAARNQLFAPLAALLLWRTQMALWIERWRARQGPRVGPWLRAWGELEALVALSGYAYEHPEDVFPTLLPDGTLLRGVQLGHPLLPRDRCVRNDVELGAAPRLLVVSGSNMSGKSTLLRTVGINAVLAQAGAPVCAAQLELSPWTVGASLSVHDSLQEGASRFYAEVKRLRAIASAVREGKRVLFLVDEILHGTNSADRRVGAQAVVEGLLARGACGIITTHDLALTEMTQKLGAAARNVHFEDQLDGGRMVFDYRLRDGVVRKSNALALMRAVGLID